MYSLTGGRRLTEYELDWLPGYEGSRPVRVGNEAAGQFQLDVYGEVLDGLHSAREAGLAADDDAWTLQALLTEHLESVWREPDASLWEVRGPSRHFVHSKVMAWVGFDRMVRTAERSGLPAPLTRWRAARDAVHDEVCQKGFDADRGTFTQFYGSRGLDASLLLLPRVGFLPADDPRVRGTVEAVRRELCEDGFVLRYRVDADPTSAEGTVDGLPGEEGRSSRAASGSPTPWRSRAGPARRASCSSGCSTCATTSACSARSGTRAPAGSWATRRRPSATSAWSTPPWPSTWTRSTSAPARTWASPAEPTGRSGPPVLPCGPDWSTVGP